jgi:hypothetical protein
MLYRHHDPRSMTALGAAAARGWTAGVKTLLQHAAEQTQGGGRRLAWRALEGAACKASTLTLRHVLQRAQYKAMLRALGPGLRSVLVLGLLPQPPLARDEGGSACRKRSRRLLRPAPPPACDVFFAVQGLPVDLIDHIGEFLAGASESEFEASDGTGCTIM